MITKTFSYNLNTIVQLASIQQFYTLIGLQKYLDNLYLQKNEEAKKENSDDEHIVEYIKENLEDGLDLQINVEDLETIRQILIDTYTKYDVKYDEMHDEFEMFLKPKHKQQLSTIYLKAINSNLVSFAPRPSDSIKKGTIIVTIRTREEIDARKDQEIISMGQTINEQLPRMENLANNLKENKVEEKK